MSLAQDCIYSIRSSLGDIQRSRWTDTEIINELNHSITRMLGILKRNDLDLGKEIIDVVLEANQEEFDLPENFRGAIGLYKSSAFGNSAINLQTIQSYKTTSSTSELSLWAIYKLKGYVKRPPAEQKTLSLVYWAQPQKLTQPASDMPFLGILDDPISDYVKLRLMNYDEMTVAQDEKLLVDMENSVLTLANSRNPTTSQSKGWLAG